MVRAVIDKLARRAEKQQAFTFLGGLTDNLVEVARQRGLRFGTGPGLDGGHHYTGMEPLPDFPLRRGEVHYL